MCNWNTMASVRYDVSEARDDGRFDDAYKRMLSPIFTNFLHAQYLKIGCRKSVQFTSTFLIGLSIDIKFDYELFTAYRRSVHGGEEQRYKATSTPRRSQASTISSTFCVFLPCFNRRSCIMRGTKNLMLSRVQQPESRSPISTSSTQYKKAYNFRQDGRGKCNELATRSTEAALVLLVNVVKSC